MKTKKLNEVPYLLDFARNIGLSQRQVALELGIRGGSVSPWATGKQRPRDYYIICPRLKKIINDKLYSDVKEWEEYIDSCEE